MGVLSTVVQGAGVVGIVMYMAGRRGLRRVARMSGAVMGQSIAGMRRSRGEVQRKFTETETQEEQQAAIEMQKGWWELRMIMNEFSMLRSFNPRLLQGGNFGFTDAEMLAAIGKKPLDFEAAEAARVSHIERQLDMERQQLENPGMFPLAGVHGAGNDAEALAAARAAGAAPTVPGADIVHARGAVMEVTTADGRVEQRPVATRLVAGGAATPAPPRRLPPAAAAAAAPQPSPPSGALSASMAGMFKDLALLQAAQRGEGNGR